MQAMHPPPDLTRIDRVVGSIEQVTDAAREPGLRAALVLQDCPERDGVVSDMFHLDTKRIHMERRLSSHVYMGSMVGAMPDLIAERLTALREERDKMSRSKLSRMTVREGYAGVPEATIKAIESEPGRVPEARIIEALADALGVSPESFYEYPIAVARAEKQTASRRARASRRVGTTEVEDPLADVWEDPDDETDQKRRKRR